MKLQTVYRHLVQRRLPYGLFSWRFFLPNQPTALKFHRRLVMFYLPKLPRALFLPVALFSGFRWMFIYSPFETFKVVKHLGETTQEKTGLTFWQQYRQVLALSMGHGVSPVSWYQYQMYRTENRENLWNNIYEQEVPAFHFYRNHKRPQNREHTALLGDKWRFEQFFLQQRIETAGTLAKIKRDNSDFRSQLEEMILQHGQLFCKRRTGNRGRGAFSAFLQESQLQIRPRGRSLLPVEKITAFLKKHNQQHDYLIQPNYKNHQSLRKTMSRHDSVRPPVTVRIVSRIQGSDVIPEFATLYWQVMSADKVNFYYPIAVKPVSGELDSDCKPWPRDEIEGIQIHELKAFIKMQFGKSLPFWTQALKLVHRLHLQLSGVDMIAWDFILSESQAVLLEGNSGWGGMEAYQWFGCDIKKYAEKSESISGNLF